jgi:rhodanese-related sulfurtransferase
VPAEAGQYNSSGKWQYLDVRTPEEFAGGHAPSAINIPFFLR